MGSIDTTHSVYFCIEICIENIVKIRNIILEKKIWLAGQA